MSQPNSNTVFYNPRGQVVGTLQGGWLYKTVDTSKHQLHSPRAWAIDAEHLDRLRAMGAAGVRLTDETGTVWTATVAAFDRWGRAFNRRHGWQVFLTLPYWTVKRPGETLQATLPGFDMMGVA